MRQTLRLAALFLRAYARDRTALFFALLLPLFLLLIFGSLELDVLARGSGASVRYVEFLLPGILGLSVMQMELLSVAFALVGLKERGALRRLQATPIAPGKLLIAQGVTWLLMSVAQVAILLAVAFALFRARPAAGTLDVLALTVIGSITFLALGFAVAGWGRTVQQVHPVAQLVTLPQFFLSGVFFAKETAPDLLEPVTSLLPLTFLVDALRAVVVQGASLWDVRGAIVGLLVWAVVGFAAAVRLLRFED